MLDLFLANSRGGWGSSENAVAFLTPFSMPKSLCYRLGGKAFSLPSVLCFCGYASCRGCQKRASTLNERNKWQRSNTFGSLLMLKASSAAGNSLNPQLVLPLRLHLIYYMFKLY